jgi:hypothetical protein
MSCQTEDTLDESNCIKDEDPRSPLHRYVKFESPARVQVDLEQRDSRLTSYDGIRDMERSAILNFLKTWDEHIKYQDLVNQPGRLNPEIESQFTAQQHMLRQRLFNRLKKWSKESLTVFSDMKNKKVVGVAP